MMQATPTAPARITIEQFICPVDEAARIIGQKWTLQIVHELLDCPSKRFCELQEALGGVNPTTLSSRLKMLEEEGLVQRIQVSALPPHVEYRLTEMGCELRGVIAEITRWSNAWLCIPCQQPTSARVPLQPVNAEQTNGANLADEDMMSTKAERLDHHKSFKR
jgi:DNA-binding HxlR family transcriptional regulator